MYLMLKNKKIMQLDGYKITVFYPDLLPYDIRKENVNIEDFQMFWAVDRALPLNRTNAKALLGAMRLPQKPFHIFLACRGLSLNDCYWVKDESEEDLTWEDVSLYRGKFSESLLSVALLGSVSPNKIPDFPRYQKIRTPELTGQGMAAKCFYCEDKEIYLYKISKKEYYASQILDLTNVKHVSYEKVSEEELYKVVDAVRLDKISETDELVVRCKLFTSENVSFLSMLEYDTYAVYSNRNVYEEIQAGVDIFEKYRNEYLQMLVVDYLLNNSDRHGQNWGFLTDADTMEIIDFAPLFDHDHAFSMEENIQSQNTDDVMSLEKAAEFAIKNGVKIKLPTREELLLLGLPREVYQGVSERLAIIKGWLK